MRRRDPRLPQPKPQPVAPKPPPPVIHRDTRGREWRVSYLLKWDRSVGYGVSLSCDATHGRFAHGEHRVVYRFRQGDDRSNDPTEWGDDDLAGFRSLLFRDSEGVRDSNGRTDCDGRACRWTQWERDGQVVRTRVFVVATDQLREALVD
jgi:hypothetical protein